MISYQIFVSVPGTNSKWTLGPSYLRSLLHGHPPANGSHLTIQTPPPPGWAPTAVADPWLGRHPPLPLLKAHGCRPGRRGSLGDLSWAEEPGQGSRHRVPGSRQCHEQQGPVGLPGMEAFLSPMPYGQDSGLCGLLRIPKGRAVADQRRDRTGPSR